VDSLRRAGELAQAERPFAIVTVVRTEPATSARTGNRAIVFPDGSMEGWVGGGCIQSTARKEGLAALEEGEPRLVRITPDTAADQHNVRMARMTCASEGTADLYVEPFLPRPTLVAAGNSPVVNTLAAIASPLGFRFVALGAGTELDEEAVPNPKDTWMVVATFGEFDEDAIEAGIKLNLPYIGLVASERRAGSVLSELRARGYGEETLKVVRSPAGLPIGASGQEEISLSIMFEIVSLRAKLRPGLPEEHSVQSEEAVDHICGMTVEVATARHTSEYDGETYYFCCPACKREFDKEPEKHAARISA
jgi:xanthine dehydrogenase accessory factor